MASLSLMASSFNDVEEYAQFVDQHMVNQSVNFRAYKNSLDESYFEAVENARQELHTTMQDDFDLALSHEGHRLEAVKQQEATAWEQRTRQQFVNDFNVQVALNKTALEAELRAQHAAKSAGKDELLRQRDLKVSELQAALARSQSTNKDLTSRIKEQEQNCSQKMLTAQSKIQQLEGAHATSNASLNSANNQIGQFNHQVQAYQNDIQARDLQILRYRQDSDREAAAHSVTRSNYDTISLSLSSVTSQRDQAQGQLASVADEVGKLRAKNQALQANLDDASSRNKDLQSQLSDFQRRSQKAENDWAEARRYVKTLEEEKSSLQSRVKELTVVSSHMETDELDQSGSAAQANAPGFTSAASEQQAGAGFSSLVSDQDSATEQGVHDDSDLETPAASRRAEKPASAKTDAKSNRIGKKKPGKAARVVNVNAVKAKDLETIEDLAESKIMFGMEPVDPRPEWHPSHPDFNLDTVTMGHEDFDPHALQYVTKVQFQLQQERNQAADDSVEQSKMTNESFVDQIINLKW